MGILKVPLEIYSANVTDLISKPTPLYTQASLRSHEVIFMPRGRPPVCPNCGSNRSQKKGVRITKTMGARRIRLCKSCGKKFTPKNQKPVHVQDIQGNAKQNEATMVEPENPVPVDSESTKLIEMQMPEQ